MDTFKYSPTIFKMFVPHIAKSVIFESNGPIIGGQKNAIENIYNLLTNRSNISL